ncbi:MAG: hypothetical protein QXH37_03885 [Candidatus Bathyarchaeia archaeon]
MSQSKLGQNEARLLQDALSSDYINGNIRLREGEYQYDLAKTIADFQLEMHFPDVKEIIEKLYGKEKIDDIQFIRKIQTILKKMEKSNIVRILPKRKPWELQKYMLVSFKFRDSDKNLVVFATDQQIKNAQDLLQSMFDQKIAPKTELLGIKTRIYLLVILIAVSYIIILWSLTKPIIDPIVVIPAFSIAAACSIFLGKILAQH